MSRKLDSRTEHKGTPWHASPLIHQIPRPGDPFRKGSSGTLQAFFEEALLGLSLVNDESSPNARWQNVTLRSATTI